MNRKVRILITLLLLDFLPVCIVFPRSDHFKFRQLYTESGKITRSVRAIIKDSDGFLWIATAGGFYRYDGYEVRSFENLMPDDALIYSRLFNEKI